MKEERDYHPLYMEQLADLRDAAIRAGDVAEMKRLVQIYRRLGYEANAAALERRIQEGR